MKTSEQWEGSYYDNDGVGFNELIQSVQSDAREGMVSKEELRPTLMLLASIKNNADYPAYPRWVNQEIARLETLLGEKGEK